MNFDAVGGRRYLLTWGCVIIATILAWNGTITGGEWVTAISLTAAAYITGNTVQKFKAIEASHESETNPGYKAGDQGHGDRY